MSKPLIYLVDEDHESLQLLINNLASLKEKFELQGYEDPVTLLQKIRKDPDLPVALFLVDNKLKKLIA